MSSFASDSGQGSDPRETSLAAIKDEKIIDLRISSRHAQKWHPREAFRELVQNWRDAIICNFRLNEGDFQVVREEESDGWTTDIVYKAFDASKRAAMPQYLGYIWYRETNGEGTVEISNRKAALKLENLDYGDTTKGEDEPTQAGTHGEGLKLALVVLMRNPQNHHVDCLSTGFAWSFGFSKRSGCLEVALTRKSQSQHPRTNANMGRVSAFAANDDLPEIVPYKPSLESDVAFTIGKKTRAIDQAANPTMRVAVTRKEFDEWVTCAIFLRDARHGSDDLVKTKHGDLLLGPLRQGNIYLKGLLLNESKDGRHASITNKELKCGYNFARGGTNRERQSVATATEESSLIMKIWSEALNEKPDLIEKLFDMLNHEDIEYADVAGAKQHVTYDTAKLIQKHLTGEEFEDRWYYSEAEKAKNKRLEEVIKGFERKPYLLHKRCWEVLRKWDLLSTAEEEERRRFTAAPKADPPQADFATSMTHVLKACIKSCTQTEWLEIRFVKADRLRLQASISWDDRILLVHERWLNRDQAVKEFAMPANVSDRDLIYHVVTSLFSQTVHQISPESFSGTDRERPKEWLRQATMARTNQLVLNYQRGGPLIAAPCLTHENCLRVCWDKGDNGFSYAGHPVKIQCHRVACCTHSRDAIVIADDASQHATAISKPRPYWDRNPTWPQCRVYDVMEGRTFQCVSVPMNPEEEYFFVLSVPSFPKSIVHISNIVKPAPRPAPVPSTPQTPAMTPPPKKDTITLGPRLKNLDLLSPARDWHEGVMPNKSDVVVGIPSEAVKSPHFPAEATTTGSLRSNKRRRLSGLGRYRMSQNGAESEMIDSSD